MPSLLRPESHTVRLAHPLDASGLIGLLQESHEESGSFGEFSPYKASALIAMGIAREGGIIGVIGQPGRIEASIGLFLTTAPLSNDAYITDMWCLVETPYRRSTRAKTLMEFAKWASNELGRPLVMQAISNEKTARKVELMERQLPKAGSLFVYEPVAVAVTVEVAHG